MSHHFPFFDSNYYDASGAIDHDTCDLILFCNMLNDQMAVEIQLVPGRNLSVDATMRKSAGAIGRDTSSASPLSGAVLQSFLGEMG